MENQLSNFNAVNKKNEDLLKENTKINRTITNLESQIKMLISFL